MWSRVRNWFTAPFTPRVEQRVTVPVERVSAPFRQKEVPATQQAIAFLDWLQGDGGITGDVLAHELMEMYMEMCSWHGWRILHWQRVAHEFALLIGGASKVRSVGGKKQRVWTIPQASNHRVAGRVASTRKLVPIPQKRVLGPLATRVEAA